MPTPKPSDQMASSSLGPCFTIIYRGLLYSAQVKKDPGRARQNSPATAGTNFTKPGAHNKGDLCTMGVSFVPFCLYPKMRSIHWWIWQETNSDSSACRFTRTNSCGVDAHGGSSTSSTNREGSEESSRRPSCIRVESIVKQGNREWSRGCALPCSRSCW